MNLNKLGPQYLKPYQREGVDWLCSQRRHKYLGDDMGLGKTAQIICAADRLNLQRILILCPASIKYNWKREFEKWSTKDRFIYVVNGSKADIPVDADVLIMNYDLFRYVKIREGLAAYVAKNGSFDLGVPDEAHFLTNIKTIRADAVLGDGGILRFCAYKWLSSGTPVLNRPIEIYLFVKLLAPDLLGDYREKLNFAKRYCNAFYQPGDGWNFNGASHTGELRERLRGFMLRREKGDVLDQLPSTIHQTIYCDGIRVDLPDELGEEVPLSTARRQVGEAKIPFIIKHIEELLDSVKKVVLFCHHTKVIRDVYTQLGRYNPVTVSGADSATQKRDKVDAFVNDPYCRVFIGQIQSAGTGIDGLQKVCHTVVFGEYEWSPGVMDQALDRCRRIGQNEVVLVQYLVVPNSIEEVLVDVVSRKRNVIQKLLPVTVSKETEDMSLESLLERIAVALEVIAGQGGQLGAVAKEVKAEVVEEKPDKKAPAKKAPAKKAKTVETKAEPKEDVPSEKDTRDAVMGFVKQLNDGLGSKDKAMTAAKEVLSKITGGEGKLGEVTEAQRAEVIAAFNSADTINTYLATEESDEDGFDLE